MRGLWVLPSRRRIAKLSRFFQSATETGISTPGVVLVQKDELQELSPLYASLQLPKGWTLLATNADGFGDKHREIWEAVRGLDWIGIACDDLIPSTAEWDAKLLAKVDTNIVTCDDGQQGNLRMSGITIFSGPVARAMGYLFPPEFWHTFVDNVWEDIGKMAECWTYVPEVLITHDHPFVNQRIDPTKADDTTYKSYGQGQRDQIAYVRWCQQERASVIERVKQLRAK